jgi:hypothetical protein
MGSAPRIYKEDLTQLELELGRVLWMAVEAYWEEIARKELGGAKISRVIWSYSETVMNPLPGYG